MLHRLPRRPAGLVAGLPSHLRICLTALLALILSAPPAAAAVCPGVTPSGCLEIHYINVQQGTSTFVVGPGGITLLLDAGGNGKGNTQIAPYLGSIGFDPGVDAFTYTLSSHLDADHIGGFDDLFVTQGYDVTLTNWYNGSDKTGSSISDYYAAALGTTAGEVVAIPLGHAIDLGEGASAEVVAVHGDVVGGISTGASDENDRSVALLIRYGRFALIWAGDLGGGDDDFACTGRSTTQLNLETSVAQALVPGGSTPRLGVEGVDVLHVNHHGSMSSTNLADVNYFCAACCLIVAEHAARMRVGTSDEEVLGGLRRHDFRAKESQKILETAKAEEGGARTLWEVVNGGTALARSIPFNDDRVALDNACGVLQTGGHLISRRVTGNNIPLL